MAQRIESVVAVFDDHPAADAAVGRLIDGGFDMEDFSVVGKVGHDGDTFFALHSAGDCAKFWGNDGVFWTGLWGLFLGGLFMTMPAVGPVLVLGSLGALVAAAFEGDVVNSGLSPLGAGLLSIGVATDTIIRYETALKDGHLLVVGHGTGEAMERAKAIIETARPARVDLHAQASPKTDAGPPTKPGAGMHSA